MVTVNLRGVPVNFPFEPYEIQKDYMEKVLECLQEEKNGVLESPTGTGKTLSLLCSTLAWLQLKKAQIQAQRKNMVFDDQQLNTHLDNLNGKPMNLNALSGLPTVIYASRTHSQLTQAMQEMKRTTYKYMKAIVLGSREQLCIHPEIEQEENRNFKIMMCRLKVQTRSCKFYNKVETLKCSEKIMNSTVMDIEDLVKFGKNDGFCPFYMSKELREAADIVFMPYNYLLDPGTRKSLGIQLSNTVVLLDEAHNVERICEDSASLQLKSSDISLAIDEVTAIMKALSEDKQLFEDGPKDIDADDLCNLKEALLNLEKEIDNIDLKGNSDGLTMNGTYIFDLFAKAGIRLDNYIIIIKIISNIVQYLATVNNGPFARKGNNLQVIEDIVGMVFSSVTQDFRERIDKCYKVHVQTEEIKKKGPDTWMSKTVSTKQGGKIINYWCFSPGFGMNMLVNQGLRSLILTSGTLAPLEPLISELELNVGVKLENPHIVTDKQVCIKVITSGPDGQELNSNFQNRNNPKYINSLGMTIMNICRVVPDGMLIFFPSYPIMFKCKNDWEASGLWGHLAAQKPIFVEPKDKNSFNSAMTEYYSKVTNPQYKGAIFMGVCRGKVSEGLDFSDRFGRSVLITGLPYPPFKDPKVVLKRQYLDRCNQKDRQFLKGQDWYNLEASRAVNQAIGRVIRHKDDYGAILLLDCRFNSPILKGQMSKWLRNLITVPKNFGFLIRELRDFFKSADIHYQNILATKSVLTNLTTTDNEISLESSSVLPDTSTSFGAIKRDTSNSSGEVVIQERKRKRLKLTVVPNSSKKSDNLTKMETKDYIGMVKTSLGGDFTQFITAVENYHSLHNISDLVKNLDEIFKTKSHLKYLIPGLTRYIKDHQKTEFTAYCIANNLVDV